MFTFVQELFAPKRPEPSYPRLPAIDGNGETTLPGVFAVGEVAGTPLIKLGLNEGHNLVHRLALELKAESSKEEGLLDLLIIGAGAAGLGAASAARDLGLTCVVLDANHLAETVYTMTKGKRIWAEPEGVENESRIWFEECSKEELLEKWSAQVRELDLDVRCFERVEMVQRDGSHLTVTSTKDTYCTRRVVLAVGKSGNPRKAGVPGEVEFGAKIDHRLLDPDQFRDSDLLIYGGGDVALEAAVALCDHNRVTLVTIDPEFVYPNRRNIDAVQAKLKEGRLSVHFASFLKEIREKEVSFNSGSPHGAEQVVANDHVFEMIGAELPLGFFAKLGIALENTWHWKRWAGLGGLFLIVHALYALKSYGKGFVAWPYENLISDSSYSAGLSSVFAIFFKPLGWIFTDEAYRDILSDRGYQQGFIYSSLYTLAMVVFGWQALIRWRGIAKNKRYQTLRYISLIGFQLAFFFLVNVIAVEALSVKYYWRAWGVYQPFPLFFNVFFWWYDGDPASVKWFFISLGLLGTFVAMPLLARYHGKRFCTWICGCGGLAETLGDRWRHLSAKGKRSRQWDFQGMVVLAASLIVGLVVIGAYGTEGNNAWWQSYNYLVDFWLVAVIPIALYPFFGGKVWCRYWCPLAAWNQVLAKWFGKLRISSNSKCISCTQCSKYCQVGVDVMAFAKSQTDFDNRNSNCIHCGICIDVCPMDVLSFETAKPSAAGETVPIDSGS